VAHTIGRLCYDVSLQCNPLIQRFWSVTGHENLVAVFHLLPAVLNYHMVLYFTEPQLIMRKSGV